MSYTELNITHLFADESPFVPFDCSNNAATLGDNAGTLTWNASKQAAADLPPLLDTEEKKQAFRDWVKESGGWSREEIAAWDDSELNAMLLQWIAGDVREVFGDADFADWDWAEYEKDAHAGRISSNLFRTEDGQVYFSISH